MRNSVPHITNAIQDWVQRVATVPADDSGRQPDICVVELGKEDLNACEVKRTKQSRWYRWRH